MNCNICKTQTERVFKSLGDESITSLNQTIKHPFEIFYCNTCGHVQKSAIPDLAHFYAEDYNILTANVDQDQIYADLDGKKWFRQDFQSYITQQLLRFENGGNILDFGSAKSLTLKKICQANNALVPHCYDVGDIYKQFWDFIPAGNSHVGPNLPQNWNSKFDYIVSYFCLEHVENPIEKLLEIRNSLKDSGKVLLILPNPVTNIADLIVSDHINCFTSTSIKTFASMAGFHIETLDADLYHGAWIVLLTTKGVSRATTAPNAQEKEFIFNSLSFWNSIQNHISEIEKSLNGEPFMIYGAGFYGTLISSLLTQEPVYFIDQNPQLNGSSLGGIPIISPEELKGTGHNILVGLNPISAEKIMKTIESESIRKSKLFFLR